MTRTRLLSPYSAVSSDSTLLCRAIQPSTRYAPLWTPPRLIWRAALRGAAAVLPTEGSRRIVVLTDAVETTGNARAAARELADQGIAVDVVQLDTGRASDALVTRIDAPVVVRAGRQFRSR